MTDHFGHEVKHLLGFEQLFFDFDPRVSQGSITPASQPPRKKELI